MNIALTGASGFIGSALTSSLTKAGHTVHPLGRDCFNPGGRKNLEQTLSHCEAIINLAGAPINHRWTSAYKKQLFDSRINVTRTLVQAVNSLEVKPATLISASAVGYYPDSGCFDESRQCKGHGLLADLCEAWEMEARQVSADTRLAITRFGVVLSPHGGAFPKMTLPWKFKTSVTAGPGSQILSWIDLNDLTKAMEWVLNNTEMSDIIHFTAPRPVSHDEFSHAVSRRFPTRLHLTIPAPVLALLLGESAHVLTSGQCVLPGKLIQAGFTFLSPDMDAFLESVPTL